MLRIIGKHICKDCLYFDPDTDTCQNNDYEPVSPKNPACHSFASDDDDNDYDNLSSNYTPINNFDDFDENNYFDD